MKHDVCIDDASLVDLFFKDSHTGFVLLDRDFNFIRVNEAYARFDNKAVDFFPGKNHFDVYPSDAQKIFESVRETKETFTIAARPFVFPDDVGRGVTYWDWVLDPILNSEGEVNYFVFSVNDVTKRVRAEKQRDRFFNLSKNMVCAASFDGFFVELSPAWEMLLGFSIKELKEKPFIDFVHPEDREKTLREAGRLSDEPGETINFINRYLASNGDYHWLSWNAVGDPDTNLIYAIAYDISDIKKSEIRLQKNQEQLEEHFEYLVGNSPAVIYTCAVTENFPATYITENVRDTFGFEPSQFLEDPGFWASNIHADDAPRVFEDLGALFENDVHMHEYRFKNNAGDYIWVRDELRLLRDEKGEPREIIGYWVDISSRRQAEEQLKIAKEEAERANRSKSDFLSSMSHELRTPMNAILGFSQLLKLNAQDKETKDSINEILKAGNHLLVLINEVLDMSRIESGKLILSIEDINIRQVVDDCMSLIFPLAQKREIRVENRIANGANVMVRADFTRLKQVILNLVSNALKYNLDGGKIVLDVENLDDAYVRILVSDTGLGMTDAQQRSLFMPFERLGAEQSDIEGTGMGLVVTKQLVEHMNGRVGVTSQKSRGSTFWVDLPEGDASVDNFSDLLRDDNDEPVFVPPDGHGKTILYIEDNAANIRLVEKILGKTSYKLVTANEGLLGLDLAQAHQPDLILLDINLPGINGYRVLERLKMTAMADVPVVAVSANAMESDVKKGLRAGFDAYLKKPIDIREFLATIDTMIN